MIFYTRQRRLPVTGRWGPGGGDREVAITVEGHDLPGRAGAGQRGRLDRPIVTVHHQGSPAGRSRRGIAARTTWPPSISTMEPGPRPTGARPGPVLPTERTRSRRWRTARLPRSADRSDPPHRSGGWRKARLPRSADRSDPPHRSGGWRKARPSVPAATSIGGSAVPNKVAAPSVVSTASTPPGTAATRRSPAGSQTGATMGRGRAGGGGPGPVVDTSPAELGRPAYRRASSITLRASSGDCPGSGPPPPSSGTEHQPADPDPGQPVASSDPAGVAGPTDRRVAGGDHRHRLADVDPRRPGDQAMVRSSRRLLPQTDPVEATIPAAVGTPGVVPAGETPPGGRVPPARLGRA
jgi:hypothetical protein